MAIVPEIQSSTPTITAKTSMCCSMSTSIIRQSFGETVAKSMLSLLVINSGVWAMKPRPLLLDRMANSIVAYNSMPALSSNKPPSTSLSTPAKSATIPSPLVQLDVRPIHTPSSNPATGLFHEPLLPHDQLSILHLTEVKAHDIP